MLMATKSNLSFIAPGPTVLALLLFFGQPAFGNDKSDAAKQKRIKTLVSALASPNEPPDLNAEVNVPDKYDRAAQQKVLDAWNALLKEGVEAFPALIASAKDKRYSCSYEQPNYRGNLTVGEVCVLIVARQVDAYLDAGGPYYLEPRSDKLENWWRKHKHQSLREMQIEDAEWALQALEDQAEEKTKRHVGKPRRTEEVEKLEAFVDRLKKPISPCHRVSFLMDA